MKDANVKIQLAFLIKENLMKLLVTFSIIQIFYKQKIIKIIVGIGNRIQMDQQNLI